MGNLDLENSVIREVLFLFLFLERGGGGGAEKS